MKYYKFKCVKDVFMEPTGQHAFVKDKIYLAVKSHENFYYFKNEYDNSFDHQVHGEWFKEHFISVFTFGK